MSVTDSSAEPACNPCKFASILVQFEGLIRRERRFRRQEYPIT